MSFVALGGDGLRPTFFELLAAERLMPSLKAAVIYSLAVSTHIVEFGHTHCTIYPCTRTIYLEFH